MASVEELDFLVETARLERELVEAKEARDAAPGDPEAQARVQAAKNAVRAHRQFWRGIREWQQAAGVPDGVAAPDTHGMGITEG